MAFFFQLFPGWCGLSPLHCQCPTCVDFRDIYRNKNTGIVDGRRRRRDTKDIVVDETFLDDLAEAIKDRLIREGNVAKVRAALRWK